MRRGEEAGVRRGGSSRAGRIVEYGDGAKSAWWSLRLCRLNSTAQMRPGPSPVIRSSYSTDMSFGIWVAGMGLRFKTVGGDPVRVGYAGKALVGAEAAFVPVVVKPYAFQLAPSADGPAAVDAVVFFARFGVADMNDPFVLCECGGAAVFDEAGDTSAFAVGDVLGFECVDHVCVFSWRLGRLGAVYKGQDGRAWRLTAADGCVFGSDEELVA